MNYMKLRNLYYLGIFVLVLYALPALTLIQSIIRPILDFQIINGLPIVSIIAIVIAMGAYMGWRFRKIG